MWVIKYPTPEVPEMTVEKVKAKMSRMEPPSALVPSMIWVVAAVPREDWMEVRRRYLSH